MKAGVWLDAGCAPPPQVDYNLRRQTCGFHQDVFTRGYPGALDDRWCRDQSASRRLKGTWQIYRYSRHLGVGHQQLQAADQGSGFSHPPSSPRGYHVEHLAAAGRSLADALRYRFVVRAAEVGLIGRRQQAVRGDQAAFFADRRDQCRGARGIGWAEERGTSTFCARLDLFFLLTRNAVLINPSRPSWSKWLPCPQLVAGATPHHTVRP